MMDELETFVHARYKQLSVPVVVDAGSGKILALGVARMPSNMKLGGAGIQPLPQKKRKAMFSMALLFCCSIERFDDASG